MSPLLASPSQAPHSRPSTGPSAEAGSSVLMMTPSMPRGSRLFALSASFAATQTRRSIEEARPWAERAPKPNGWELPASMCSSFSTSLLMGTVRGRLTGKGTFPASAIHGNPSNQAEQGDAPASQGLPRAIMWAIPRFFPPRATRPAARWCSGSTSAFGAEIPGSNPGRAATRNHSHPPAHVPVLEGRLGGAPPGRKGVLHPLSPC